MKLTPGEIPGVSLQKKNSCRKILGGNFDRILKKKNELIPEDTLGEISGGRPAESSEGTQRKILSKSLLKQITVENSVSQKLMTKYQEDLQEKSYEGKLRAFTRLWTALTMTQTSIWRNPGRHFGNIGC